MPEVRGSSFFTQNSKYVDSTLRRETTHPSAGKILRKSKAARVDSKRGLCLQVFCLGSHLLVRHSSRLGPATSIAEQQQSPKHRIAAQTGAKVIVMLPSVGGEKQVTDYFKLFGGLAAWRKCAMRQIK